MADITRLKRQRGHIQAMITTLKKILDSAEENPDQRNLHYISSSLESARRAFDKFENIQEQIEEIDVAEIDNRAAYVQGYNLEVARAQMLLQEANPAPIPAAEQVPAANQTIVQTQVTSALPPVTVPTFDGAPENWFSFFNLFEAVLEEHNLKPVKKLHFLRTALSGKAANVIESLELTDDNYQVAVSILKERYESTRRLTRRHWAVLREYPRMQKDSPTAISQLVDTFNQHTRALENLKAPVCYWDIPLVDLILSKIGSTTAWHWELTLTDDKIPSYKDLLKFLGKRAACGDSVRNDTTSSTSKPEHHSKTNQHRPHSQAFYSNNKSNQSSSNQQHDTSVICPVCDENHRLYTCNKFRELTVEERRKAIANAQLCFNCFGKNHAVKSCNSKGTCRKCSKRHNTLLHFENTNNSSNQKPESNNDSTESRI